MDEIKHVKRMQTILLVGKSNHTSSIHIHNPTQHTLLIFATKQTTLHGLNQHPMHPLLSHLQPIITQPTHVATRARIRLQLERPIGLMLFEPSVPLIPHLGRDVRVVFEQRRCGEGVDPKLAPELVQEFLVG